MSPSAMPSVVNGTDGMNYPEPTPEGPYRVLNQYHSRPDRLRVACVGAGASGLCLAYKMEKMLEPDSWTLTLFEKNPHFGG
jgi:monoamine oxidase